MVDKCLDDLDDWEVITGYHQNRTVPQSIETSVYFQLVGHKSSDKICQPVHICCTRQ